MLDHSKNRSNRALVEWKSLNVLIPYLGGLLNKREILILKPNFTRFVRITNNSLKVKSLASDDILLSQTIPKPRE